MGRGRAVRPACTRACRRHRRPLDRLAGRPHARDRRRRPRRGDGCPRLPADGGNAGPPRSRRRLVRPATRRAGPDPRPRPSDDRLEGARRPASAPARARVGRRRRAPACRVSDLRRRCPARRVRRLSRPTIPRSGRRTARLIWINSPGNPDGRVWDAAALRAAVDRAREIGAVLVSDECYAELGWDAPWDAEPIPSVLDPRATGGDLTGILSVYSLSKQSNLAGYRAAFLAGDPEIIGTPADRAQASRAHASRPGAGGDGRGPRRRGARRRAEGALPSPARLSSSPRSRPPASASTTARPGSTSGPQKAETRGTASGASPTSAFWPVPATSTARISRSTCGSR